MVYTVGYKCAAVFNGWLKTKYIAMKQLSIIFLIVLAFANIAFAQRNPNATSPPPPAKVVEVESPNPLELFSKKGLPEPYIIGNNRSDELAEWLATEIMKFDEQSLPILMAALQKTGFYIMDKNQKILYKPTATYDFEMSFYDFEVVGMLKIAATGKTTNLKKLAEIISQNNSQIPADKLSKTILEDLRAANNSTDVRIRFAAKLIFELGRKMDKPVDLTTSTPENYKINAIQLSLIERILLGDLMDSYSKLVTENLFNRKEKWFKANEIRFVNAGFLNSQTSSCDAWDDLSTLQNTSKNVYQRFKKEKFAVFQKTLDECELITDPRAKEECKKAKQQYLEILGKGLKFLVVTVVASKLQAAFENIKIVLNVQEPSPLIRTKSSTDLGETRDITAKFTIDPIDKDTAKQIACMKSIIPGSIHKLELYDGFTLDGKSVTWNLSSEQDSVLLSSQSDKLTGQSGQSLISLVGKSQPEDLTNRKNFASPTTAELTVNIKNDQATLGSRTVQVPIRDWIPCTDDWAGTVHYYRSYKKTDIIKSTRQNNGNGTGDGIRTVDLFQEAFVKLNPRRPEDMKTKIANPADIRIHYSYKEIFEGVRENDPCCGKTEGSFNTKFTEGKIIDSKPDFIWLKLPFSINYSAGERDFSLSFNGSTGLFPTKIRHIHDVSETNCPLEEDYLSPIREEDDLAPIISASRPESFDYRIESGRYGQRFVGSAGEVLFGEKFLTLPDKSDVLWQWDLYRCRD